MSSILTAKWPPSESIVFSISKSCAHHGDTKVTEAFVFLPIGRRRWAKIKFPHKQEMDFVPTDVSEDVPYVIIFMKACTKAL